MHFNSSCAVLMAAASLLSAMPSEAQVRYFARQNLVKSSAKTADVKDRTYTCGVLVQGYVASFSGVTSPAFAASSPEDARTKCNASKAPSPNMVLNMCVYSTTPSTYGAGVNAIAIWQDPSNTDHSRSYSSYYKSMYSSDCTPD